MSECKEIREKMSLVLQTIDLVDKLSMPDPKEGKILPIWCNLPTAPDPLQNLIQYTLKKHYGFDNNRIQRLKEKVRRNNPKYK